MSTTRLVLTGPGGMPVGTADVWGEAGVAMARVNPAAGARPALLAEALVAQLPGHRVRVNRPELAEALIAGGGQEVKRRLLMAWDLAGERAPGQLPAGYTLAPLLSEPSRYARLYSRAYPPGHPDHDPAQAVTAAATDTIAGYLTGEAVGPFDPVASSELRDEEGNVVGAAIVNVVGLPLYQGPWLTELLVDPAHQRRGLGGALVTEVANRLHSGGHSALGLAVTHALPARRLYERLGFGTLDESWWIDIPAAPPSPGGPVSRAPG